MKQNYIRHVLYLRNIVAYDHAFWYTFVKWYFQAFFHFFKLLILGVVREVKGQKMVQNDKKFCLSHSISQEPYIIWLSFVVHICKMMISPVVFFHYFKYRIFQIVSGVKEQKIVQNGKKFCPSQSSSQEPDMCKMIMSPQVFFIFLKILILQIVSGVKEQKMTQNDKTLCSPHSISQEPCIIWLSFMVHICKIIISLCVLFLFSGSPGWWKGRKWSKMTKYSVCHTLYFRNYTSYDLHLWFTSVIYGTQV